MTNSLLPPNATRLERAVEAATARIGDVPVPIDQLWDPATLAADLLPWLGWALSVDNWDPDWTDAEKRRAIAESIALHRIKGTRASVETVLSRFDDLVELVEWHQAIPRAVPHTFEIRLPIAREGIVPGGRRATAAFAEAIVRDVARVKPTREHFILAQTLALTSAVGIQGAGRLVDVRRADATPDFDTSPAWNFYLQTEDGEPLQDNAGAFLDTAP
jgi:phage tail P2-like protein